MHILLIYVLYTYCNGQSELNNIESKRNIYNFIIRIPDNILLLLFWLLAYFFLYLRSFLFQGSEKKPSRNKN